MGESAFDCEGALRLANGDRARLREILGDFLLNTPQQIARLKQACAGGDLLSAAECAQMLRQAARICAAADLDQLSEVTESAARSGRQEETISAADKLHVAWMVLERQIREYLESV